MNLQNINIESKEYVNRVNTQIEQLKVLGVTTDIVVRAADTIVNSIDYAVLEKQEAIIARVLKLDSDTIIADVDTIRQTVISEYVDTLRNTIIVITKDAGIIKDIKYPTLTIDNDTLSANVLGISHWNKRDTIILLDVVKDEVSIDGILNTAIRMLSESIDGDTSFAEFNESFELFAFTHMSPTVLVDKFSLGNIDIITSAWTDTEQLNTASVSLTDIAKQFAECIDTISEPYLFQLQSVVSDVYKQELSEAESPSVVMDNTLNVLLSIISTVHTVAIHHALAVAKLDA